MATKANKALVLKTKNLHIRLGGDRQTATILEVDGGVYGTINRTQMQTVLRR
jgi:hypothetical protein